MWLTIQSVASLLTSYGLLMLANGMFATLLGLRSRLEGFSTEIVGFIMAGFFVGMLLGALYAVRIVASAGHIRAFAAFASVMSISVLAHILLVDPFIWFALRAVAGFCMAGMVMIVESWLNERAGNNTRGQVLSLYMITNYMCAGTGQFLLNVADPADFQLFSLGSIIFSLALVPILMTRATAPKPTVPERMKFKDLFLVSPVGVLGCFTAGMTGASFNTMAPIFAKDIGMTVGQISIFIATVLFGGMLLQFPIGKLSDRFDRRSMLIMTTVSAAAGAAFIIWATDQSFLYLLLAGLLYGGFCYTIYPISSAQVNDLADPERLVQISAGLLLAYGGGASIGPIIAAQIMGLTGPHGVFLFTAAIALSLALYTAFRMARRRPGDAKAIYLPLGVFGTSSKQLYNNVQKSFRKSRKPGAGSE